MAAPVETFSRNPQNTPSTGSESWGGINTDFLSDEIYFDPAFSHLFHIDISEPEELGDGYTRLRCSSFSFSGDLLELSRDVSTQLIKLSKYTRVDTVTINWREQADRRVFLFHKAWFDRFYNRETDRYVSGIAGKLRTFTITLQRVLPGGFSTTGQLILHNVLPEKLPDFSLDWETGTPVTHSLTYKFHSWEYRER